MFELFSPRSLFIKIKRNCTIDWNFLWSKFDFLVLFKTFNWIRHPSIYNTILWTKPSNIYKSISNCKNRNKFNLLSLLYSCWFCNIVITLMIFTKSRYFWSRWHNPHKSMKKGIALCAPHIIHTIMTLGIFFITTT